MELMSNKPIHEIRVGRIKAALWANQADNGPRHTLSLCRLYKSDEGWRSSDSFSREDIPLVIKVLVRAHDWMYDTGDVDGPEQ